MGIDELRILCLATPSMDKKMIICGVIVNLTRADCQLFAVSLRMQHPSFRWEHTVHYVLLAEASASTFQ